MTTFDTRLKELQNRIYEKRHIECKLKNLQKQEMDLDEQVRDLYAKKVSEQADVDKLQCRSLAAFFYKVTGKMEEHLTKEQAEAYAAAVKYDAAFKELADVQAEIKTYKRKRLELGNCEKEFEELLLLKKEAIQAAGTPDSEKILALEEQLAKIEADIKELEEAKSAGMSAFGKAELAYTRLENAAVWSTFDIGGGGLLANISKHSALDEAQTYVEDLQIALRHFKTELCDTDLSADLQVKIDGFLRFADFFFDGFFVDLTVHSKIDEAKRKIDHLTSQIESITNTLNRMISDAEKEKKYIENSLEEEILRASLGNG